ncbi:MAG: M20/M25/M40 family metallo-hydrolase [Actinomycetota bacterium]|jgi:acetylornithine deacetylase|nr:M20/M25/M40 family metallo-hydrolase [Actinomycetota bacterium]
MTENIKKIVSNQIEKRKKEIEEWLKKLISIPSENRYPEGFEAQAQNFIKDECKKCGFEIDTFLPTDIKGIENHDYWLAGRNYGNDRKNVVARWKGDSKGNSVLLSGHVDVAPYEPDNWKETRPFIPLIKEDKLFGRGAADMKGGLAASFWAMKILKDSGFKPSGDIIFESLVDEEFAGGNGTLASRLKGYNTDFAIVPEPTRMEICSACPGAILGEFIIKGNAGMPYMGLPIYNPIDGASRIIHFFKEWIKHWRSINSHELFLEKGKELNYLLWDISTRVSDEIVQMGTPAAVKISWVVWVHPDTNEEEFFKEFKEFWDKKIKEDRILKNFEFDIKQTFHFVRPWQTDKSNKGVSKIIKSYSDYTGIKTVAKGATFSCDMAIYGDVGRIPIVLLGPRGDNLHGSDEWVLLEDIFSLIGIFIIFIKDWCK